MHKIFKNLLLSLLMLVALGCFVRAGWISAKAVVAQWLIADAWEETLRTQRPVKPWRWADTWPVAMLTTPTGKKLYVMEGFSGQSLAFGPGYLSGSAVPGGKGNAIIAAHRDTHFEFLEFIKAGDVISLQDKNGSNFGYRVDSTEIMDAGIDKLHLHKDYAELELITCYPFHALSSGGSLRYVVHAVLNNMARH